jgi:hypothetical protein
VVIATAQEVLHSHLRAGLITQQVTYWLNLVGLVPLALCAWNCWGLRGNDRKGSVRMVVAALVSMIALQAVLFGLHPLLDGQIVGREVSDAGAFFKLHRLYLVVSTAQWLATLVYLWFALALWEPKYALTHQAKPDPRSTRLDEMVN